MGDVVSALKQIPDESVDFIYTDPPFNTGDRQEDNRTGRSYLDKHNDYLGWCSDWLQECRRVLKKSGTIYVHLDDREGYRVRAFCLDTIFGEQNYLSTVIWAYDYGQRSKDRWPAKHDTIYVYAKEVGYHIFNVDAIDKLPYMSPPIRKGQTRSEDGKMPTDVWWMSIVGTNSKERVGYPNQKPEQLIKRAVLAASNSGDVILDPFAGSGTTGAVALELSRNFILIDSNQSAHDVMQKRFAGKNITWTKI